MQNPFKKLADNEGTIRQLTAKLHPLSYATVCSYINGDNLKVSNRVKEILAQHYSDDEVSQIANDYKVWRANR